MMKFSKGRKQKDYIYFQNRCHSWIGHTIRHNEFVVNSLEGAISGKKAVGRHRLQYLEQVARNAGADSYTAMKRMACNSSRWKAANQSKDWGIRRRWCTKSHFAMHMNSKTWYCLILYNEVIRYKIVNQYLLFSHAVYYGVMKNISRNQQQ
jgi:hypothetical protein